MIAGLPVASLGSPKIVLMYRGSYLHGGFHLFDPNWALTPGDLMLMRLKIT